MFFGLVITRSIFNKDVSQIYSHNSTMSHHDYGSFPFNLHGELTHNCAMSGLQFVVTSHANFKFLKNQKCEKLCLSVLS